MPRQRCTQCNYYTFTFDYELGLIRSSTASFRREIVQRCKGRALSDVARDGKGDWGSVSLGHSCAGSFPYRSIFYRCFTKTKSLLRRSKKTSHIAFIDHCLACQPTALTQEERGFIAQRMNTCVISINPYSTFVMCSNQLHLHRQKDDWTKHYQFHTCGAVAKIVKKLRIT